MLFFLIFMAWSFGIGFCLGGAVGHQLCVNKSLRIWRKFARDTIGADAARIMEKDILRELER